MKYFREGSVFSFGQIQKNVYQRSKISGSKIRTAIAA
jgi:hypothetical protein